MYEKFSLNDIDSAGRGGEYTVQVNPFLRPCPIKVLTSDHLFKAGFGWTNGVLLWVASTYGSQARFPLSKNLRLFDKRRCRSSRPPAQTFAPLLQLAGLPQEKPLLPIQLLGVL